ncbi:uncharacterized protein [Spinacia oleracea]|uniref:Integrase catalytic domain-containing protein n=1 Tax=Spinacia oleracea TaxID=3562 RepID=A0ABM3RP13_SPIOL|nr:uncharacterized protein LOC130471322 [Spinacia oleracea]
MANDDDQSSSDQSVDLDYYLGSGDGPGIVITPVKLRGASNYDEWAKAVRRSLVSKFKFGFIDGSITEPTSYKTKMKHWIAVNSMVVSWITNTVAENLRSQLEDFDVVEELWTHLRKRFCVVSGTRICYIKTAIGACKQTSTDTVTEYYACLSKLWKELVMYARVPRCTCGACKCNIAQQVGDIRAEDHLHYFLIRLDEPYEAIHAQLLAQVPLPSVDVAYQTVVNTESLRVKEGQAGHNVMAFKVEARPKQRYGEGEKLFCQHCNREGHSEETCYQIIGFPEWWDEKKRGGRGPGRGGRGSSGRGRGSRPFTPSSSITVRANDVQGGLDQLTRMVIGVGERQEGLYFFRGVPQVRVLAVTCVVDLWHERMGHPSEKILKLIPPVSNFSRQNSQICDVCPRAKKCRESFPNSDNKANSMFELVYIDLWGPYKTISSCGAKYFLTIVDDFSRGVWVYLISNKTKVESIFLNFIAMIKRQFNKVLKVVRSDNGTEFNFLQGYFFKSGILFESSCVGTPQQNGRVERKNQHILNVARALRFQGNFPKKFWGECILAASYLINRTPTPILQNKTPNEMLFGELPSYESIRLIGCLCYAYNLRSKGDKFESRSRKCVFLGYPFGKKGWQLYDLERREYFVSRDVRFHERVFPYVEEVGVLSVIAGLDELRATDEDVAHWDNGVDNDLGSGHCVGEGAGVRELRDAAVGEIREAETAGDGSRVGEALQPGGEALQPGREALQQPHTEALQMGLGEALQQTRVPDDAQQGVVRDAGAVRDESTTSLRQQGDVVGEIEV